MQLRALFLAATALTATALTGTALTGFVQIAHADITFAAVPFAADDAAKRVPMVSASAMVNGVQVPLADHAFARSGDMKGPVAFGQLLMLDGRPVPGANVQP